MSNGLLDGGGESPPQIVVYSLGAKTKSNFAPPESKNDIIMVAQNQDQHRWIVIALAGYRDGSQSFEVRKIDMATNHISDYETEVWSAFVGILEGMGVDFEEEELIFSVQFAIPHDQLMV